MSVSISRAVSGTEFSGTEYDTKSAEETKGLLRPNERICRVVPPPALDGSKPLQPPTRRPDSHVLISPPPDDLIDFSPLKTAAPLQILKDIASGQNNDGEPQTISELAGATISSPDQHDRDSGSTLEVLSPARQSSRLEPQPDSVSEAGWHIMQEAMDKAQRLRQAMKAKTQEVDHAKQKLSGLENELARMQSELQHMEHSQQFPGFSLQAQALIRQIGQQGGYLGQVTQLSLANATQCNIRTWYREKPAQWASQEAHLIYGGPKATQTVHVGFDSSHYMHLDASTLGEQKDLQGALQICNPVEHDTGSDGDCLLAAVAYGLNFCSYATVYNAYREGNYQSMAVEIELKTALPAISRKISSRELFDEFRTFVVMRLRSAIVEEIIKHPDEYAINLEMENVNEAGDLETQGDHAMNLASSHARGGRTSHATNAYQEASERYGEALGRIPTDDTGATLRAKRAAATDGVARMQHP